MPFQLTPELPHQSFFLCLPINRAIYLSLTLELNRQVTKYWRPAIAKFTLDSRKSFRKSSIPSTPKKTFLSPPNRRNRRKQHVRRPIQRPTNFQRSPFAICHFFSRPLISQLIRPTSPLGRMKLAVRRLISSGAESEAVHLLPRVYLVPFTADLS